LRGQKLSRPPTMTAITAIKVSPYARRSLSHRFTGGGGMAVMGVMAGPRGRGGGREGAAGPRLEPLEVVLVLLFFRCGPASSPGRPIMPTMPLGGCCAVRACEDFACPHRPAR
jgi:hypothetical protein